MRFIAEKLVLLLAPFTPHLADELWYKMGHETLTIEEEWPRYDPGALEVEEYEMAVQVNGKVRDRIKVPRNASEEEIKRMALSSEKVKKWLNGKEPKKIVGVKKRLISIVV